MAICKDCIYLAMCYKHEHYGKEDENPCEMFKNKADFVEVKHGEWLADIQKITTPAGIEFDAQVGYKCHVCGRTEKQKEPYCNCGAKMYGVKEE